MPHRAPWVVLALFGFAGLEACRESDASMNVKATREARGKYLVDVIGCTDCHTPFTMGPNGPQKDATLFLAGHPENAPRHAFVPQGEWVVGMSGSGTAFAGPWGVSYAINLTPDVNTGIGVWTEEIIVRALREGRHWGQSRPIMPPMPWEAYRHMSDEDLKSIYAYLRTLPPVKNRVPDYEPPAGSGSSED